MRRQDRAIMDPTEQRDLFAQCFIVRLGLIDDDGFARIVPVHFILNQEGTAFYFHSATAGEKVELLTKQPAISFEADMGGDVVHHADATKTTATYASVHGRGIAFSIQDQQEKKAVMDDLLARYEIQKGCYSDAALAQTLLYRVEITHLTAKRNR